MIENAGSCAEAFPSLTLITMLLKVATFAGVPCRRPELVLNVAQDGRFVMLKVSGLPSTSRAVGANEYSWPTVAPVGGVPLMVGAVFDGFTVIANAGRAFDTFPSLTLITMLLKVPTEVAPGVPSRAPEVALKFAHVGRLAIVNASGSPSGSAAVGWNTYEVPSLTEVDGAPLIVGSRFVGALGALGGAVTTILNDERDAVFRPSLAAITMSL